jgi:molecular chaperone Hsp33
LSDQIIYAHVPGLDIRLLAGVTTEVVAEARRRHDTYPLVTAALGRTLTGTVLLGLMQKDLERITVQFSCTGPVKGIVAAADAHGHVRGYATNPQVGSPAYFLNEQGKLNVAAVVGAGTMYVERELGAEIGLSKEPYRGAVEIVSGEIAYDFAYYLTKSEQIPSGVSLGVFVDPDGDVAAAGGFIVQIMPGADPGLADDLTQRLAITPHASQMVREGATPLDMLRIALGRDDIEVLKSSAPSFRCTCSYERAVAMLAAIDKETLDDVFAKGTGEEVVCPVCNEHYFVSIEALRDELARREGEDRP